MTTHHSSHDSSPCHSFDAIFSTPRSNSPPSSPIASFESARSSAPPEIATPDLPDHIPNLSTPDDFAKLASHGIKLMLNNNFVGAEKLFCKYKDDSVHMAVGYCYLTFLVSKIITK